MLRLLLNFLCLTVSLSAASYYVDYDAGSDANNGTSQATPWKHLRGDANATGTAAAATFSAGDTINFKGGVHYRGSINFNFGGSAGNVITIQGSPAWGTGKSWLDGSVPFTGTWTQCIDAADAFGNANWSHIWKAPVEFVGQSSLHQMILDDAMLYMAQDFVPSYTAFFDDYSSFGTTAVSNLTTSSLTLTGTFTQSDSTYWDEAYIAFHHLPNTVSVHALGVLTTATDTVAFSPVIDLADFTGSYNPAKYSLFGHPLYIFVGSYAVKDGYVYYWPTGDVNPNTQTLSVAKLNSAISITSQSYVTVTGFKISGYMGDTSTYCVAFGNTGSGTYNGISLIDCDIKNLHGFLKNSAVGIYLGAAGSGILVDGWTMRDCAGSRGFILSGNNVTFSDNVIDKISGTALWYSGAFTGSILRNTISDVRGSHGNGLAVYQTSSNITIANNQWLRCASPLNIQQCSNVYFYNNVFDCTYGNPSEDADVTGTIHWINNTVVNSANNLGLQFGHTVGTTYVIRNNLADGITWSAETEGTTTRTHNQWLGYAGGTLGAGEFINTDYVATFIDSASGDYRLMSGSAAIGVGVDVSAYSALLNTDINGIARTQWDIGAYAYVSPNATPRRTKPSSGTRRLGR